MLRGGWWTAGLAAAMLLGTVGLAQSDQNPAAPTRPAKLHPAPAGAARTAVTAKSVDHVAPPPLAARYRVGALLTGGGNPHHYCTASVVHSPRRNLLITAAHCIHEGPGGGYLMPLSFAPGDGTGRSTPAGVWRVRSELVDPAWSDGGDPDADVAFLTVQSRAGRAIEDVVGANPVAFGWTGGDVALIGYPDTTDSAHHCAGTARPRSDTQLRVYCPGFTSGTSGAPWLSGPNAMAGAGTVVGVLGGFRRGGWSADVSYSSVLDRTAAALYRRAAALP